MGTHLPTLSMLGTKPQPFTHLEPSSRQESSSAGAVSGGEGWQGAVHCKIQQRLHVLSLEPPPLPTMTSCPGPGGPWYKTGSPQGRGKSCHPQWGTKALLLLWPMGEGLAEEGPPREGHTCLWGQGGCS